MAQVDVTRIASNIGALNSLMYLTQINNQLAIHQTRLASGKRINSAADDPAGLVIATKLYSRSDGLKVALGNIADAKNLLSVAESGVSGLSTILIEMRNKAEQAASDTLGVAEREANLTQLRAYAQQMDDVVQQTEWNGNKLIDGSLASVGLTFQTGPGAKDQTILSGLRNLSATGANSLKIGFIAAFRQAEIASDPNSIISATPFTYPASGAYSNTNANVGVADPASTTPLTNELSTGLYQVKVEVKLASDGNAAHRDLVIKLQDAGGSDLTNAITVTNYAGAAVQTVDFSTQYVGQTTSRGIDRVDLATSLATAAVGTYSAVIGYTRKDDYNIKTNGAGTEGTLTTAGANGRSDATNKYLATAQQYNDFMSYLETKANEVNQQMAMIGSFVGRLSFKEDQVTNAQINVEGSWNRIMNANMAEEQVNASKLLILQQTATAMLAQANAAPQFLLSLFK